MPTFNEQLNAIAQQREAFKLADQDLYLAKLQLQRERDPDAFSEIRDSLSSVQEGYDQQRQALQDAIAQLYADQPLEALAAQLDARFPILFLPLRLETRLRPRSGGALPQLLVRAYPDDIHIHTHEELLMDAEIAAGQRYWLRLLAANRDGQEADKEKAWRDLTAFAGANRALWIARETRPGNWSPGLDLPDDELDFPEPAHTKTHPWTRAPRTELLPDKLIVNLYRGDQVFSFTGNPIPEVVFMGPDPFKAEEAFRVEGRQVALDDDFAWTTDFDRAVDQGMALVIDLEDQHLHNGRIDRLVAVGLRVSADPGESKRNLEALFTAHQFSKNGLSLISQGTPTNNVEKEQSGYTKNELPLDKPYYDGADPEVFADQDQAEGKILADALGIRPQVLEGVQQAGLTESREARAMNTALYPGTIGYFFEVLMRPVLGPSDLAALREYFTEWVTARGPLPAIRIGDQPYGCLLTSNFQSWAEPRPEDQFFRGLTQVLRRLQTDWDALAQTRTVHTGKGGDPAEVLLQILGLRAGSVDFESRLAHLPDLFYTLPDLADPSFRTELETKQTAILNWLQEVGYTPAAAASSFTFASSLLFYPDKNPIPLEQLVDTQPVSDSRRLESLPGLDRNYIEWLAAVDALDDLENHRLGEHKPPRVVLYLMLHYALLQQLSAKATDYYGRNELNFSRGAFAKTFYNFNADTKDLTSWEFLRGAPTALDSDRFTIDTALGEHYLKLPDSDEDAAGLAEMRAALRQLAPLSTKKLERYLCDHIDLCSYRLDAWQTGLFHRRLQQQRSTAAAGIYLGAYGWVEDLEVTPPVPVSVSSLPEQLRPEDPADLVFREAGNAGFLHAPSLNQAHAAGLLLGGYHQYATPDQPGIFSVNLSSERVRRASFVYDGIRNGQSLESLLGYQFERSLHDVTTAPTNGLNLNQYILAFREQYVIEQASIPQRGAAAAQETIPAFAVVNGLKLLEAWEAAGTSALNDIVRPLVSDPADAESVNQAIAKLADTMDALNDLLTAESAYQVTQGNFEKGAALLSALKRGELPPDLDMIRTERSSLLTFTHRMVVHFNTRSVLQPPGPRWPVGLTPRSLMEPGINQWLASVIGDPTRIICRVVAINDEGEETKAAEILVSNLSIQPIDLVYITGAELEAEASELEARIATAYRRKKRVDRTTPVKIYFQPELADPEDRSFAEVFPLLHTLRLLLTTGRPAGARAYISRVPGAVSADDDGYDAADLKGRIEDVLGKLEIELTQLDAEALSLTTADGALEALRFSELFARYQQQGQQPELLTGVQLDDRSLRRLFDLMRAAADFGVQLAYPADLLSDTAKQQLAILQKSATVWKAMAEKRALTQQYLSAAAETPEPAKRIKLLTSAAKALLGEEFMVLPRFRYTNAAEMQQSLADQGAELLTYYRAQEAVDTELAMEQWLQSVARVRPALDRLERVRLFSEALGAADQALLPAQIPFREKDNWLGVEFPALDRLTAKPFDILRDTVALAIQGMEYAEAVDDLQSALIIDEWTEKVPGDKEITGITFNFNQPNASPPNAMLLAVEPTGADAWSWPQILGTLSDTLQRAKSRLVEPQHLIDDPVLGTLLPMTIAKFDVENANVSLDYKVADPRFLITMRTANLGLYNLFIEDED